jgi:hypothetical protein
MATLADAVSKANAFRFPLADMKPASFRPALNLQLGCYLLDPVSIGDDVARIAIAAGEEK